MCVLLRKQSQGWLPLARHQFLCARVCSRTGCACDTQAPWGHRRTSACTVQQTGSAFVRCADEKLVHAERDQQGPFISAPWYFTGVVISGTVSGGAVSAWRETRSECNPQCCSLYPVCHFYVFVLSGSRLLTHCLKSLVQILEMK